MTIVRLLFTYFYYLLRPVRITYSPLPSLVFTLSLLMTTVMVSYLPTLQKDRTLLTYSPTPSSLTDQKRLFDYFVQTGDYALAFQFQQNTNLTSSVLGISSDLMKILYPREYLKEELVRVSTILEQQPTSRDLWLYKGWVCVALAEEGCRDDVTQHLLLVDPNNNNVQDYVLKN